MLLHVILRIALNTYFIVKFIKEVTTASVFHFFVTTYLFD